MYFSFVFTVIVIDELLSDLDIVAQNCARLNSRFDGRWNILFGTENCRRTLCDGVGEYKIFDTTLTLLISSQLLLSLSSFFHLLALTRTLSNSVETSLTTAALCFWPWHLSTMKDRSVQIQLLPHGSCSEPGAGR